MDDDPNRIPHKLSWIELPLVEWVIVRNYDDFVKTIERDGVPTMVSFDHDLADEHYQEYHAHRAENRNINYDLVEKTGFHCAKWLAQYCVDKSIPIPNYYTHTMNPSGAENIKSILESAKKVIGNV